MFADDGIKVLAVTLNQRRLYRQCIGVHCRLCGHALVKSIGFATACGAVECLFNPIELCQKP